MTVHWLFDDSPIADPLGYGERAVEFLRRLKHPRSTAEGKAFTLDKWQERLVRRIYGPRHADGTRIIKTVFLLLPRGNRKTSLSAALALLHTIGPERVQGGEVISAASDQKQAKLGFNEALGIIRADKRIASVVKVQDYQSRLKYDGAGTFYEAVSNDSATQHGRTPSFVFADELHAWKKRDLWDVLRSGLPKTKGSLCIIATTAGRGQDNIAFDLYDYAKKVNSGEFEDPAFLPVLFEADKDCDWQDEQVWHDVNPGLQCNPPYPDIEGLRQFAREAVNRTGDRETFRQLNLNIWLDHSAHPFVDMDLYDQGNAAVDTDALVGQPCWLGVDLSSNEDLTAIVAAWRADDEDGNEGYIVRPWFFCPEDNLRAKADLAGVPYPQWAEQGLIETTAGNTIDHRRVEAVIREICEEHNVREIAFDKHLAGNIMANLQDDGLPAVVMPQSWAVLAPANKELERAIISGRFQHGGNAVLRWNFANIQAVQDRAGNTMMHKAKSKNKIDGAIATAMAVGRAFNGESNVSIYSNELDRPDGLLVI